MALFCASGLIVWPSDTIQGQSLFQSSTAALVEVVKMFLMPLIQAFHCDRFAHGITEHLFLQVDYQ